MDGEFPAYGCPDFFDNLQREPHPSFEVPAVFVGALVEVGRIELLEKKALSTIEFQGVRPGLFGTQGGCGEFIARGLDVFVGHDVRNHGGIIQFHALEAHLIRPENAARG